MPAKKSYLTTTDQFCGCGGSSSGAKKVLDKVGGEITLALNHWKLAIETHNTNFPDTKHDCTDISACDPRRYPSTDILITSPECTTHSPAGGNNHKALKKQMDMFDKGTIDPATQRSRATMYDVVRFAEYHRYRRIIVENVVEAKTRWPLFDNWLGMMHTLGYDHRCVYLNSMHFHPTPQSRDRMYIVFWRKGDKAPNLDHTPTAYCVKCSTNVLAVQAWKRADKQYGKYRQQYLYCCPSCSNVVEPYYYASFNCIDWSDIGTRIGDRKKPLSPNTVRRIEYGLAKYGQQPLIIHRSYGPEARGVWRSVGEPFFSQTTDPSQALVNPFLVNTLNGENHEARARSITDPSFAQTTYQGIMLINPLTGFIIKGEHAEKVEMVRHLSDSLQTQVTRQSMALVTHPFLINDQHSTGVDFRVKSTVDHIPTIQTTHQLKLVTPPFVVGNYTPGFTKPISDTVNAVTCQDHHGVCTPPFMIEMTSNGKAREFTRELNTATAGAAKTGIVTTDAWNSFVSYYYNGSNMASSFYEAIGSQTTKGRNSLVTYQEPNIEDCYYRMLKAPEVKLAMAFDNSYIVLGSAKDQVKQLGNAVTPPAMEFLMERVVESLM